MGLLQLFYPIFVAKIKSFMVENLLLNGPSLFLHTPIVFTYFDLFDPFGRKLILDMNIVDLTVFSGC